MGNYHPILMEIGTQTKTGMLSSKVTKAEAYGKKTAKIKRKIITVQVRFGFFSVRV
jgi:hypothetical protein